MGVDRIAGGIVHLTLTGLFVGLAGTSGLSTFDLPSMRTVGLIVGGLLALVRSNGKPAPAGHPKDAEGRFISATNGDALLTAYVGAVCRNARHEGGRTLVDVVVNEAQAKAHPDGAKLVERLDAAISGNNADPIHVSTGLFVQPIQANGESRGKKYDRIATGLQYDHLAILLNERGAGTPEEGVGMFLNAAGQPEASETPPDAQTPAA